MRLLPLLNFNMNLSELTSYFDESAWFDSVTQPTVLLPNGSELSLEPTLNFSTTSTISNSSSEQQHHPPCSEESKFFLFNDVERFALLLFGVIISITAVVLNCLVLACFAAYPTLRSPSNIYVVHLAVCGEFT